MSEKNSTIAKALGLNTQPNELSVPEGSLTVAENIEITRDNVAQMSAGFEDFSSNLPDFLPEQIFSFAGTTYLHTDSGWWYYDTTSSSWLRKRGLSGPGMSKPAQALYSAGHIYISSVSHVIFDFNLSTGSRTVLAGRIGVSAHTDGTGDGARFNNPYGMVSDGTNLYVTDAGNNCIRKVVIATGVVTTPYGVADPATTAAHTDGTGNAARFNTPAGIVSDGTNLYVCDNGNNCIRKIVISSGVVTTPYGVADPATTAAHTDGTGNAARFSSPRGLLSDGTNLYVCEGSNNCIRKIVISSGVVTTPYGVADPATTAAHTDGTGNAARFSNPDSIISDGTNFYVTDIGNSCIRKIVISSGVVTTPYGVADPATTAGNVDGIGNAARFSGPRGLVSDGTNMYVCDNGNQSIRKIYVSTGYVTTVDIGSSASLPTTTGFPFASSLVLGPS